MTFFVPENSQFWDDDNYNLKNDISTEPCDFQYSNQLNNTFISRNLIMCLTQQKEEKKIWQQINFNN